MQLGEQRKRVSAQVRRRRATGSVRAGMTLIEVAIAGSVLVVGLLGFMRVVMMSVGSSTANREADLATQAAKDMIEQIQAANFATLHTSYGVAPGGAAPGNAFAVPGLNPDPNDPDGMVGEIILPVRMGAGGIEYFEGLQMPELGMPRDLTGDGDMTDAGTSVRIVPVLVRLRWRGATGVSRMEYRTQVADY